MFVTSSSHPGKILLLVAAFPFDWSICHHVGYCQLRTLPRWGRYFSIIWKTIWYCFIFKIRKKCTKVRPRDIDKWSIFCRVMVINVWFFPQLTPDYECVNFTLRRQYPAAKLSPYIPVEIKDWYSPGKNTFFRLLFRILINKYFIKIPVYFSKWLSASTYVKLIISF